MSFKIDPRKFKRMSSDGKFTTLQHADGHTLKIAHTALSPKMRDQLNSLPQSESKVDPKKSEEKPVQKLASGGKVKGVKYPALSEDVKPIVDKGIEQYLNEDVVDNSPMSSTQLRAQTIADEFGNTPVQSGDELDLRIQRAKALKAEEAMPEPQATDAQVAKQVEMATSPSQAPMASSAPLMPASAASTIPSASAAYAPVSAVPQAPKSAPIESAAVDQGMSQINNGMQQQDQVSYQDPYAASMASMQAGAGQIMGALSKNTREQEALAKENAKAIEDAQVKRMEYENDYKKNYDSLLAQRDKVEKDYMESKIDPTRLYANASTGQKITTALALLVGGMTSGANGQTNLAQKVLDTAIERDVEAQKADMGKKYNLFQMNYEKTKDLRLAHDMTVAQMKDFQAMELQKNAAKHAGTILGTQNAIAAGELKMKVAGQLGEVAKRQTISKVMNNSAPQSENDYRSKILAMEVHSPEHAKTLKEQMVPGVGVATRQVPEEDIKAIRALPHAIKNVDQLGKLAESGTLWEKLNPQDRAKQAVMMRKMILDSATSMGTLTDAKLKFDIDRLPHDANGLMSYFKSSGFKEFSKQMRNEYKEIINSRGIVPFADSDLAKQSTQLDFKPKK